MRVSVAPAPGRRSSLIWIRWPRPRSSTTASASSSARRRAQLPASPCGLPASPCRRPCATPRRPEPAHRKCSAKPPTRRGLPCPFNYLVNRTVEDEFDELHYGHCGHGSGSDELDHDLGIADVRRLDIEPCGLERAVACSGLHRTTRENRTASSATRALRPGTAWIFALNRPRSGSPSA